MNTFPDGFFTPPQIIIVNNQFYIYQYNEEFNTEKYYVYQVIPGKAMYSFLECQFYFFFNTAHMVFLHNQIIVGTDRSKF